MRLLFATCVHHMFRIEAVWHGRNLKGEKADRGIPGSFVSPYPQRFLGILRIPNGSSVSHVSPMDSPDSPYRQWILCILISFPTSLLTTTYSYCILVLKYYIVGTLRSSSAVLWGYLCVLKCYIMGASLGPHVLYYGGTLRPSWPIPLAVVRILIRQLALYLCVCPQGRSSNLQWTDLVDRLDAHYLLFW